MNEEQLDSRSNPQVPTEVKNEDQFGVAITIDDPVDSESHGTQLPNDKDFSNWPRIGLKSLELVNFCKYEDVVIDFTHNGRILPMACLVGPNGTGKTTILDAVTMLCSNYSGYDPRRFSAMMYRRVRNWIHLTTDNQMRNASFKVRGTFEVTYPVYAPPYIPEESSKVLSSDGKRHLPVGEYIVEFTRHGVVSRHPEFIEMRLPRYVFMARFDQELSLFQLKRDRWPMFQELFSAVTGFPIEEDIDMFYDTSDARMRRLQNDYVLGFVIHKPKEIIRHKMCSSGERKIAKCFSTILNAPIEPCIIAIDNVLMHIEVGRHLAVMSSLLKCFPSSQLIVACHSIPVAKCLPDREMLFDMRWLDLPGIMWREAWRLRILDDVQEALERLSSIATKLPTPSLLQFISEGASLPRMIETNTDGVSTISQCLKWLSRFPSFLVDDLFATPKPKIRWYDDRQSFIQEISGNIVC
jgi:energy-coupling factor transporter ATP-binding protein EcfA2